MWNNSATFTFFKIYNSLYIYHDYELKQEKANQ